MAKNHVFFWPQNHILDSSSLYIYIFLFKIIIAPLKQFLESPPPPITLIAPNLYARNIIFNILSRVALCLYHLRHKDLLHLSVVQVVQVPHRVLRPGDQVYQDGPGLNVSNKLMLK